MACGLTGHNWVDDEDSWSYFGKGRKFDEEDHKGQTCSKCQESQVEIRKHAHQIVGDACVSCGRGTGKGRWRLRALLRGNNMVSRLQPVVIEDARIIFRNFAGAEGRFNAKGKRNFNVLLDDDTADAMLKDGWNVKYLQPRLEEEDAKPQPRLEVAVHYGAGQPPRVVMITTKGKTSLDESMLPILDWAEIENVDMIIRPHQWEVSGKTGVKAYLKSIYVTIREDELERKYMDVPDSAISAMFTEPEPVMIHQASEQMAITRGDTPF